MSNMKRSMRRVFWLLALCFFLLLGYLGKLVLVDRAEISGNAYNHRLRYVDETIRRGDILDRDGEILATSVLQNDGTYSREYPRARMAAHITGYSSVGKSGVEAAENFTLMALKNELIQRVSGIIRKTELMGNSVALTVDMDIQSTAGNLLGSAKGAIVVMEPSTGRVLALQAYPDFNPNSVENQWETLKDHADSPLVNRATQGIYPPGSTFKTVTALAAMEHMSNWQSFTVECTGEMDFQDKVIHC
ncbi:MAG: penicillin-binding protein 2, partial [Anaerotignum sp.]|nr:penicillin-binding protein 2 [Anaerotignum sp.]